ncbi:hypothetical protein CEUSTIGMA_g1657.t1 [Chlamydomonas eustigma]|uniref:Uncharacterized protein n=1 Tax=Chlamydomonas eustigma TaxID=1157962 RepID=A0A250WTQ5_9CHLO|nr:hypothetical protein CEUSTIGMA_g1657.t1 [Chlamydomonas eustigma]|eukprot:GAX74208.1 hypothetical protein CEUSTIGMA_g1657.t1 [Chlamydomonas eustigma]
MGLRSTSKLPSAKHALSSGHEGEGIGTGRLRTGRKPVAKFTPEREVIYVPKGVLEALKEVQKELDEAQKQYQEAAAASGAYVSSTHWGTLSLMDKLVNEEERPPEGTPPKQAMRKQLVAMPQSLPVAGKERDWLQEVAAKRKAEKLAAKLEAEKAEEEAKKAKEEAKRAAEELKRAEREAVLQKEMEERMVKLKHIEEKHSANTIGAAWRAYKAAKTDAANRELQEQRAEHEAEASSSAGSSDYVEEEEESEVTMRMSGVRLNPVNTSQIQHVKVAHAVPTAEERPKCVTTVVTAEERPTCLTVVVTVVKPNDTIHLHAQEDASKVRLEIIVHEEGTQKELEMELDGTFKELSVEEAVSMQASKVARKKRKKKANTESSAPDIDVATQSITTLETSLPSQHFVTAPDSHQRDMICPGGIELDQSGGTLTIEEALITSTDHEMTAGKPAFVSPVKIQHQPLHLILPEPPKTEDECVQGQEEPIDPKTGGVKTVMITFDPDAHKKRVGSKVRVPAEANKDIFFSLRSFDLPSDPPSSHRPHIDISILLLVRQLLKTAEHWREMGQPLRARFYEQQLADLLGGRTGPDGLTTWEAVSTRTQPPVMVRRLVPGAVVSQEAHGAPWWFVDEDPERHLEPSTWVQAHKVRVREQLLSGEVGVRMRQRFQKGYLAPMMRQQARDRPIELPPLCNALSAEDSFQFKGVSGGGVLRMGVVLKPLDQDQMSGNQGGRPRHGKSHTLAAVPVLPPLVGVMGRQQESHLTQSSGEFISHALDVSLAHQGSRNDLKPSPEPSGLTGLIGEVSYPESHQDSDHVPGRNLSHVKSKISMYINGPSAVKPNTRLDQLESDNLSGALKAVKELLASARHVQEEVGVRPFGHGSRRETGRDKGRRGHPSVVAASLSAPNLLNMKTAEAARMRLSLPEIPKLASIA